MPPLSSAAPVVPACFRYVGVNAGEVMAAYLYASTGKNTGQRPNELGPQDILAMRDLVGDPRKRETRDSGARRGGFLVRDDPHAAVECGGQGRVPGRRAAAAVGAAAEVGEVAPRRSARRPAGDRLHV